MAGNPLTALLLRRQQNLTPGYQMTANDPADAYDFQQQQNDDFTARIGEAEGAGDTFNVARLKALLKVGQGFQERSPIPHQREQVQAFEDNQYAARQEGFDGSMPSAQKGAFERKLKQQAVSSPLAVANANNSGARLRNLDTIGGEQILERLRHGNQMETLKSTQEHGLALADRYADSSDDRQLTGVDAKGNPKFRYRSNPNINPLLNRIGQSRMQLRGIDPFDTPDNAISKVFMQDLANVISQHDAGDDAKADFWNIVRNPNTRNLRIEELTDASVDDPDYIAELADLLNIARGGGLEQ